MNQMGAFTALLVGAAGGLVVGAVAGYLFRVAQYEARRLRRVWRRNGRGLVMLGQVTLGAVLVLGVAAVVLVRVAAT